MLRAQFNGKNIDQMKNTGIGKVYQSLYDMEIFSTYYYIYYIYYCPHCNTYFPCSVTESDLTEEMMRLNITPVFVKR